MGPSDVDMLYVLLDMLFILPHDRCPETWWTGFHCVDEEDVFEYKDKAGILIRTKGQSKLPSGELRACWPMRWVCEKRQPSTSTYNIYCTCTVYSLRVYGTYSGA